MIMSLAISDCVGAGSPVPLKGNILQCIDHAKRLGFDGVELHMRNAKRNDYSEIADYAAKLDMKVTSIGTGLAYVEDGHYLTNEDPEALKRAQQVLIDFLKAGKTVGGAAVMFGLMKGSLPEERLKDAYKDRLFENLKPVVEAAEKLECDFTIEAINRFQSPYFWTAEETLDFVNRFKSERVTLHLDTFHMNIEERDLNQAIRISKEKLGYFHLSDSDRCYPGHGRYDYESCMQTLYEIGYAQTGVGGHEYNAQPDGVTAATRGLAHMKQFLR